MSDWRERRVVLDKDGDIWVGNGDAWISWSEPEAVSDGWLHRYYGPLTPVLDADGHLVPEMAKLAKAWAEGYVLGSQDAAANHCSEWRPNPYRQATA